MNSRPIRATTALVATLSLLLPQVTSVPEAQAQERVRLCRDLSEPPCPQGEPRRGTPHVVNPDGSVDRAGRGNGNGNGEGREEGNGRRAEREAQREAERDAQRDAEREAQREAEREAEREAQRQAEREAQRDAERQAQREAERDAERQAQREAERQAQQDAEREAQRDAEREAQQQAEREAEREARREAERDAQRDAERQAQREAERETERQAEREAQRDAERQAEREARREAEQQAQEEAQRDSEREAQQEAEQDQAEQDRGERAAEREARREAEREVRREAEAEARAREEVEGEGNRNRNRDRGESEADRRAVREAEARARAEAQEAAEEDADAQARAEERARSRADRRAAEELRRASRAEAEAEVARDAAQEEADRELAAARAAAEASEGEAEIDVRTIDDDDVRRATEDFETEVDGDGRVVRNDDDDDDSGLSNFEKALLLGLGAAAVGTLLNNGQEVVTNSGDRVVTRNRTGGYEVYRDDDAILRQPGSQVRTETFADGSTRTFLTREDGTQVVTIRDANGRVLRRARILPDGTQVQLFDDTEEVQPVDVTRLLDEAPPPVVVASQDLDTSELRALLEQGPDFDPGRTFSLRQIREISAVRNLVPAIDLQVSFPTGSAAIPGNELSNLVQMGILIEDALDENPGEVFLVEGHTDAVGSEATNLALSDRRAESVALALTENFDIPPENLVVQGYGEEFLKVATTESNQQNRRATLRRITPLLGETFASR
ncbi:OmpA family protein [Rubellimicrobium arenae]|uniref:OmpA family protein n=1 Tax=Rubellimicrobium arenae TaxID=2817372 RepID=UPI001B306C62|nr:OmpA family protein [Rubellimicrobium arenae]